MAGQHFAFRRHVQPDPRPTAHAGFGKIRQMVRRHVVDDKDALQPLARLSDDLTALLHLIHRWHQSRTVLVGPAVILRVGDLKPPCAQPDRQVNRIR